MAKESASQSIGTGGTKWRSKGDGICFVARIIPSVWLVADRNKWSATAEKQSQPYTIGDRKHIIVHGDGLRGYNATAIGIVMIE